MENWFDKNQFLIAQLDGNVDFANTLYLGISSHPDKELLASVRRNIFLWEVYNSYIQYIMESYNNLKFNLY